MAQKELEVKSLTPEELANIKQAPILDFDGVQFIRKDIAKPLAQKTGFIMIHSHLKQIDTLEKLVIYKRSIAGVLLGLGVDLDNLPGTTSDLFPPDIFPQQ